jgi:hypothetical protein
MRTAIISAALLSLVTLSAAKAENLPTIHEVYDAAKAGHLSQARNMVDTVLKAKPNSSKAHFVKAEICANQSDLDCVRNELASAKRIDPGLAFANPASVDKLENIAAGTHAAAPVKANTRHGFPWGLLLLGLGIVALIWWIVSLANRRAAQNAAPYPGYGGGSLSPTVPGPGMSGMSPGYGTPMQTGGFGSSLGKSLATGAALGAGMVAGEALADSLLHHGSSAAPAWDSSPGMTPGITPDLGGADFGIGGDSWDGSSDLDSLGPGGDW